MIKDFQLQQQNKSLFNSASYSSKEINENKKTSVEDKKIKIIGTMPAISRSFSPIVKNIEIPQTHRFSEGKQDHNFQYRGQHDSSYY